MSAREPRPLSRQSVPWLFISQLYVLLQLTGHLPYWIYALLALTITWRSLTHMGRVSYPSPLLKAGTVLVTSAAVIFTSQFDLESATAFLVAAGSLKLLEMRYLKDAYVVIFLNLFIQGIVFLFEQSILYFLFAIVGLWLLLATLVMTHYVNRQPHAFKQTGKVAAHMMLWSLPMMLVLYFLFPRIGPLWGLTLQSGQALTGLSDSMNPADIADLSQSSALAFRATFADNQLPARQDLYWRALVLDHYNGRQWSSQYASEAKPRTSESQSEEVRSENIKRRYEIIQEATGQNWLFSLAPALAPEQGIRINKQGLLRSQTPIFQRKRYNVLQKKQPPAFSPLSAQDKRAYLQLPQNTNPRTQALVRRLQQATSSDLELLDQLMHHFNEQTFYYTLQPQILGKQEIDDFMFNTQAGFCAHYAGALTFMARTAGIPARVVAGYQGGEWNESDQYLSLRQYDAHAWVEIWQPEQGWLRYDPTAMVAADRIEFGLEEALANEDSFLQGQVFSMQKYKHVAWINQLRMSIDSINYQWQRWVLSYDNERQKGFLEKILGFEHWQQSLYAIAVSFVAFFLIASLVLWWKLRASKPSPFMQSWLQLQQTAERLGVEMHTGETVSQFCQRLAQAFPQQQDSINRTGALINRWLYQPGHQQATEAELIAALKTLARRLRKASKEGV